MNDYFCYNFIYFNVYVDIILSLNIHYSAKQNVLFRNISLNKCFSFFLVGGGGENHQHADPDSVCNLSQPDPDKKDWIRPNCKTGSGKVEIALKICLFPNVSIRILSALILAKNAFL